METNSNPKDFPNDGQKVHYGSHLARCTEEQRQVRMQHKMRIQDEAGGLMSSKRSGDFFVEGMMTRHRPSSQIDVRNGLPLVSGGDKPYRNPEYAPNFYKQEGIVNATSLSLRPQRTGIFLPPLLNQSLKSRKPKTWTQRVQEEESALIRKLMQELNSVHGDDDSDIEQ